MTFTGKIAFITGAASGIGRACAQAFAAENASVALVDRDPEGLAQTLALLPDPEAALAIPCDVVHAEQVNEAVHQTVSRWGGLDCAVNSAGLEGASQALVDEDEALYDRVMDVNVRGVWHCMRAQIGQMLRQPAGGSIVNVSSGAGLVGSARCAVYGASKHAVVGLTRSASLQYARKGVRVNVVCPSGVQTPMAARIAASTPGGSTSAPGARYPIGRHSTPEEIASGILWLSSPGAASTMGSVLAIDAGMPFGTDSGPS